MKTFLLCLFTIFVATVTHSQKLPNVQDKPLRAPANVKIDGKADEWTGLFQAKNSATELTYVISNDDEYLYLVFQATVPEVYNKVMMSGITFQINKNNKKEEKGAISIAYPIFDNGRPYLNWRMEPGLSADMISRAQDSLMEVNNKKIGAAKSISLRGIVGVDSLLSVYNDQGFKAANMFSKNAVYTCEMAIPLKHLGLQSDAANKFTYHVALNGGPNKRKMPVVFSATLANGEPMPAAQFEAGQARLMAAFASTDFWGEYTLAARL